jgi:CBS domain-containing protein
MPSGLARTDADSSSLFATRVRDLIRRPPVICAASLPAILVARLLSQEGVGSVVVCDDQGVPVGIVTDRDLRKKVVAEGRDPSSLPARSIMSSPLVWVGPGAFAFEAILEMTRREIHHLVVVEAGRLVGVLSTYDLLRLHAAQPVTLAREIARAPSLTVLGDLAARITPLVRHLFEAGGTASDIGQMVAELNDRAVARVLALTTEDLVQAGEPAPPVAYCWLVLGSEARREQTLRTDQDNGLVYADPPPECSEHAAAYFARFAEAAVRGLTAIGFPVCPANLMASNPEWRQPLSVWSGYFRQWIAEAWPSQVAAALTLFDLRPLAGASDLAEALLEIVRTEARASPTFLSVLAREALAWESPFRIWGRLAVERRGPHPGAIDVKRAGTQQLVGAGRVHALELGLAEMNTLDRLRAAARLGVYRQEEVREIEEAYQFLMRLRLAHQLTQVERGGPPDNWIQPAQLSRTETLLLREALRTIEHVKTQISKRYKLTSLPGI